MLTKTYWLDKRLGGRCSPKHYDFERDEIENATILCLEEKIPKQDKLLVEIGKRVLHLPFPKIQPKDNEVDRLLASQILIKGLVVISNFLNQSRQEERLIIHCGHGNDRTGIILLGYLICHRGMGLDDAMRYLKVHNYQALTYTGFEDLSNILFNL